MSLMLFTRSDYYGNNLCSSLPINLTWTHIKSLNVWYLPSYKIYLFFTPKHIFIAITGDKLVFLQTVQNKISRTRLLS
jgi:hypothetical protein